MLDKLSEIYVAIFMINNIVKTYYLLVSYFDNPYQYLND